MKLLRGVFDGKAVKAAGTEAPTGGVEGGIKIDTAMALVRQIDDEASDAVWRPYINKALTKKGGYDLLMANLNLCLSSEKQLQYSPDGTPAFV